MEKSLQTLVRPSRLLSLAGAALGLGLLSFRGVRQEPQEQEPAPPQRQRNELVSQLSELNVKMRNEVTRVINAEAENNGFSIRREQLAVTSLDDRLIVAGAPVADVKELAKEGREAFKKGLSGEDIIGVMVVAGKDRGVAAQGKERPEGRPLGGVQAGTFLVLGAVGEGMSSVKIVGRDQKVIAEVQLEEKWMGKSRENWWQPIYMSILNKLAPMVAG